ASGCVLDQTVNESAASASRSLIFANTPEARTDHCVISPSTQTSPSRSICILMPPETFATEKGVSGEEPFGRAPGVAEVMPSGYARPQTPTMARVITNGRVASLDAPAMPPARVALVDHPVHLDG